MKAKQMPAGNRIVGSFVLNRMSKEQLAKWYGRQSYFNLCQLQDVTGYSSAAGLAQIRETVVVRVDNCRNIYPTV